MSVLELRGACAAPWGPQLLTEVDLTLAAGSILGVLGPNGAGKSSLLHVLAGGIGLSGGEVRLGGRKLQDWGRLPRARALSMLAQSTPLNFPFAVEEVILLARIPHRTGSSCDRQILSEVMAATDTVALRKRRYTELSGGEKQRVQLARAMAQVWRSQDSSSRVLLLDEPTSALDPAHQQLAAEAVQRLAADGCAVVVVMHDFNQLAALADQLTVLDAGRQVVSGSPQEVLTGPLLQAVFGVAVHIGTHPTSGRPLVIHA